MVIDKKKIQQIYAYLSSGTKLLQNSDCLFVFGRDDPLLAAKAAELYHKGLVKNILISGGIGKDSRYLKDLNCPEAIFQAALLNIIHKVPKEVIYVETKATNGGECARFGLQSIVEMKLPHKSVTLLVHATSLKRLMATIKKVAYDIKFETTFQAIATDYQFDAEKTSDQREAVQEIIKLADYPAKGFTLSISDIPPDLLSYAREIQDNINV